MNGFAAKVRYPLALLGGSLLAAPAHAAGTNQQGSSFDGLQLGVKSRSRHQNQYRGKPMKINALLMKPLAVATLAALSLSAEAQDTIKVGILHSLSGTMAISETTLKDTMLMMIADQNAKGGLLGKKLEAVVVDPASDWPLFAEKARELIEVNDVAAVFGCWTSVSRKSVLPVFEELNSLLFYPVQYEGEESSKNVFYTGAAPNQQAIPAVDYLMNEVGVERWVLAGTDYVYPRTTNRDPRSVPQGQGRRGGRHHDQLHAVRSLRLAVDHRADQGVRLGGQEDGRRLDDQRRRERAVLQRARQPGRLGRGHPRRRVLGRRRGAVGHRHDPARRPPRGLELLHEHRGRHERRVHQGLDCVHQEPGARDERPDGSALHRLQDVGRGRRESRNDGPRPPFRRPSSAYRCRT